MNWSDRRVLVSGGASFIGSALVDALVRTEARVRVVDNLTSGRLDNLRHHLAAASIEFAEADLRDAGAARDAVENIDVVFHLAGSHDRCHTRSTDAPPCDSNLRLDRTVFRACASARVEKVVFASRGAENPVARCSRIRRASERLLRALARQRRLRTASCRYFSVYGERDAQRHMVTRLVANAFAGQRPFIVPGDRLCRWTYVRDVAAGILLAAERIDDGTSVDLETIERVCLLDAARALLDYTGHDADIQLYPDAPLDPITGTVDPSIARVRLGWSPRVTFAEGLSRTVDWYFSTNGRTATCGGRRPPLIPVPATRAAGRTPRTMAH